MNNYHGFEEELAYSHSQADAPYWQAVYKQAFPDMATCLDLRHDGWHQRAGRDRAVVLTSGRMIYIDEKPRRDTWDDIAVEVWSTYPRNGAPPYPPVSGATPGWGAKPLDCDFVAYAFVPARVCYLFPFLGIRAAWVKHARMWIDKAAARENGFSWVVAPNRRYNTISIAVPIKTLQDCVNDALTICWSATVSTHLGDGST